MIRVRLRFEYLDSPPAEPRTPTPPTTTRPMTKDSTCF